jgi:aryl-alcohol dehydrogenase-like predicted oxidoreductase
METTILGTTGFRVSRIGMGLAALGRPGYINLGHASDLEQNYDVAAMQARAHAVLDAAYAGGVRYFDAARSYGRAEQFLGTWLKTRKMPQQNITVGSKWGYTYTAGWRTEAAIHEVKEHSPENLKKQWQESQVNLGSYLKLYQIHSATIESGVLENSAVLDELLRIKNEGTAIGLSVSGSRQREVIAVAVHLELNGVRLFDCVQATWNLLEKSAGEVLARAASSGMGVIVKEALANGRLTERNREPGFAPKMKLLRTEAQRLETTVDGLAMAAVLVQPWADVVLSGAARVDHLQANLGAAEVTWDAEAEAALEGLMEPEAIYWKKRADLAWN